MADAKVLQVPHKPRQFSSLDKMPCRDITLSSQLATGQRELIPFSGHNNEVDDKDSLRDHCHLYNYCHSNSTAAHLDDDNHRYCDDEISTPVQKRVNLTRQSCCSRGPRVENDDSNCHEVSNSAKRSTQRKFQTRKTRLSQKKGHSLQKKTKHIQPDNSLKLKSNPGFSNKTKHSDVENAYNSENEDVLSFAWLQTENSDFEEDAESIEALNLVACQNRDSSKSISNNSFGAGKHSMALVKTGSQNKNSNANDYLCPPNLVQEGLHNQEDSVLNPSQIECLLSFAVSHGTSGDMIDHCKMALLSSDYNTVINNYLTAVRYQLSDVMDTLIDVIRRDFECVSQTQQFLALPVDVVIMFLEDNHLNLRNELDVFFTALSWVDYNKQERLACAGRVLNCVRYVHIDPLDIIEYVEPNINLFTGLDGLQALVNMYRFQALMMAGVIPYSDCDGLPSKRTLMDVDSGTIDNRITTGQKAYSYRCQSPSFGYLRKVPDRPPTRICPKPPSRDCRSTQTNFKETSHRQKKARPSSCNTKLENDHNLTAEAPPSLHQTSTSKEGRVRRQIRGSSPGQLEFHRSCAERPRSEVFPKKKPPDKILRTYSVRRCEMPRRKVISVQENVVRDHRHSFDWMAHSPCEVPCACLEQRC